MLDAIDGGSWLQAGATILVAALALVVGISARRNKDTTDAIEDVRDTNTKAIEELRQSHARTADRLARRIDTVADDTSATRADVAEIKGYLAAVQGDHFVFRRPAVPPPRRDLEDP
ncbi:MAG TPA: hypothetical protein VGR90_04585 [Acidimicrobiales bacterium]|nr:hypothetical protein [Acidimicrobiales bacterium]